MPLLWRDQVETAAPVSERAKKCVISIMMVMTVDNL